MKKHLLLSFALVAALLTSCKKDNPAPTPTQNDTENNGNNGNNNGNNNGGNNNNNGNNNGNSNNGNVKLLTKVTEVEDGETTVYTLEYDSKNRLTLYKNADGSEINTFTYDGNDNLIKIEYGGTDDKQVYEINYNGQGVPQSGKYKYYDDGQLEDVGDVEYKVANGVVTETRVLMEGNEYSKATLSYNSGNVTEIKFTAGDLFMGSTSFTFGNKKGVFAGHNTKYVVDMGFSAQLFNKNNYTKQVLNFGGQSESEITYNYTFGNDGYPTSGTATTKEVGTGEIVSQSTTTFEYK